MPISFPGSRLREGIDMGLLFRSVGYSHRLHRHGRLCQFPHCFPSMDIYSGYPTLSLIPGIGLCSWLCIWLVIDPIMFHVFMSCVTVVHLRVFGYYSFFFFFWDYGIGDFHLWWNQHPLRTVEWVQFWLNQPFVRATTQNKYVVLVYLCQCVFNLIIDKRDFILSIPLKIF